MDELWGHYAKGSKSDREGQMLCDIMYMWYLVADLGGGVDRAMLVKGYELPVTDE